MKARIWIISSVVILVITALLFSASIITDRQNDKQRSVQERIEDNEPEGVDTPEGIVWNPDTGEYYNADKLIWDEKRQTYIPRTDRKSAISVNNQNISLDEWMEINADSNNTITAAVYKYLVGKEQYIGNNPDLLSASYNVEYKEGLEELRLLGTSRLIEIYSRINEVDCINSVLMNAITEILGIEFLAPTNRHQDAIAWMEKFEDFVREAHDVADFSDENVKKYGLLLLPSMVDQGISSSLTMQYSEQETKEILAFILYVTHSNE
ncbi:MAG: hypothetical protein IKZ41_05605 [Clostridia bacterium]|nr:hypothetical protein [Clostridia bacterium]MBR5366310.1 hypothetical protein [Clostridia bacterium]